MRESRSASRGALTPARAYHLAWCLPAIFLIGAPTLLTTRFVFAANYPQKFTASVPSISETAAYAPSADIFQWLMSTVGVCIFVFWPLNLKMNTYRLRVLARPGAHTGTIAIANAAATALGLFAGASLILLGVFRLHDGPVAHDLHMELSIQFYASQVTAFLIDGWSAVAMRRVCTGLDGSAEKAALRNRAVIGVCTLASSMWFLYLFLDRDGLWGPFVGQQVYVATEYTLAMLCLAYPSAAFPEVRRHFRLRAEEASQEDADSARRLAFES